MALRTPALVRQGGKAYHAKTILNHIEETSNKNCSWTFSGVVVLFR